MPPSHTPQPSDLPQTTTVMLASLDAFIIRLAFNVELEDVGFLTLSQLLYLPLAYLLFSPESTIVLRRTVLAVIFPILFVFFHAFKTDKTEDKQAINGIRFLLTATLLRAVQVGLMDRPPLWIGPKARIRNEKESVLNGNGHGEEEPPNGAARNVDEGRASSRPQGRKQRLVFAITYFYAWRNLGWSDSLRDYPEYHVPRSRKVLLWTHARRAVLSLFAWDFLTGTFNLHPTLNSIAQRSTGSLRDSIPIFEGAVVVPGAILEPVWTLIFVSSILVSIAFEFSLCAIVYTLLHPGSPDPFPLIIGPFQRTSSLHMFWAESWHMFMTCNYLFCGGLPGAWLGSKLVGPKGRKWGRNLGVFILGGLHHSSVWWFNGTELEKAVAFPAYATFFLLQPLGLLLENLFSRYTYRRVSGPLGAIWTWTWLLYWGMPISRSIFRIDAGAGQACGVNGEAVLIWGTPVRTGVRVVRGWLE